MSEIGKYIVVQKRFQHKLCIKRAIGIGLLQNDFLIITYEFDSSHLDIFYKNCLYIILRNSFKSFMLRVEIVKESYRIPIQSRFDENMKY